ncbi:hypothetical protein A3Q56_05165 [Intoshia linei]|uniref:FYVE-type domain-containing protein n=1 Tax=Intoshia linei TaxID=1819745 RepID=A0A177AYT0_9BILA|nr:hypothetical protein A3Q56_05165 [Intoshia linei]
MQIGRDSNINLTPIQEEEEFCYICHSEFTLLFNRPKTCINCKKKFCKNCDCNLTDDEKDCVVTKLKEKENNTIMDRVVSFVMEDNVCKKCSATFKLDASNEKRKEKSLGENKMMKSISKSITSLFTKSPEGNEHYSKSTFGNSIISKYLFNKPRETIRSENILSLSKNSLTGTKSEKSEENSSFQEKLAEFKQTSESTSSTSNIQKVIPNIQNEKINKNSLKCSTRETEKTESDPKNFFNSRISNLNCSIPTCDKSVKSNLVLNTKKTNSVRKKVISLMNLSSRNKFKHLGEIATSVSVNFCFNYNLKSSCLSLKVSKLKIQPAVSSIKHIYYQMKMIPPIGKSSQFTTKSKLIKLQVEDNDDQKQISNEEIKMTFLVSSLQYDIISILFSIYTKSTDRLRHPSDKKVAEKLLPLHEYKNRMNEIESQYMDQHLNVMDMHKFSGNLSYYGEIDCEIHAKLTSDFDSIQFNMSFIAVRYIYSTSSSTIYIKLHEFFGDVSKKLVNTQKSDMYKLKKINDARITFITTPILLKKVDTVCYKIEIFEKKSINFKVST